MLELSQNGNHQSGQHQDGRWKFDEVTKMWSAMSEEEKHAYTEDFKVREALDGPAAHCRLGLRCVRAGCSGYQSLSSAKCYALLPQAPVPCPLLFQD